MSPPRRGTAALPAACNLLSACVLIVLAVIPEVAGPETTVPDDVWHAAAYGLQAGLLWWALSPWMLPLTTATAAWVGATGLGVFTELLQRLQPARTAEVSDVLADAFGAAAVVVACLAVRMLFGILQSGRRHGAGSRRRVATVEEP